ncbi:hypothetical protein ABZ695_22440 [Streptomyces sp. NPDC006976]|uniref:Uncharacterized protein n=1 Tax=Streptomyces castrisilvae TaxID=3033811 RepID=A0ABY9HRN9_9ACTN|nr:MULTISPECIES: hypothetical protein [unclassified Streptomyces]MYY05520.1 hypothetical protein [Streptomyces sp. SID4913]WLQ37222.1 hypothetical protein P8A18_28960 [Streptomyces sp. Mut1]
MTATAQLLGGLLAELREVTDSGDALDSAIVAAVEGAQMIAVAAEAVREGSGEGAPLELAREALGAMRASVVAATVSVRTLEDRRRMQGVGSP